MKNVLEGLSLDAAVLGKEVMAHFVFGTILVAILTAPLIAISYNEASAQERETCLQARSHCGTQPICQRRYDACLQTGCWTVGPVKRCGYQPQ